MFKINDKVFIEESYVIGNTKPNKAKPNQGRTHHQKRKRDNFETKKERMEIEREGERLNHDVFKKNSQIQEGTRNEVRRGSYKLPFSSSST